MTERRPCSEQRLASTASVVAILACASVPVETLKAKTSDPRPDDSRDTQGAELTANPIAPTTTQRTGWHDGSVGGGAGGSGPFSDAGISRVSEGSNGAQPGRDTDRSRGGPATREDVSRRSDDDGNAVVTERALIEPDQTRETPAGRWSTSAEAELASVLTVWVGRAGFAVVVNRGSDNRLEIGFSSDGNFREAVEDLLAGFATAAVPPVVAFYANDVMTIGARR